MSGDAILRSVRKMAGEAPRPNILIRNQEKEDEFLEQLNLWK
jgi:hypothetical protein